MFNSYYPHKNEKKERFLSKLDLEGLTREEKEFAEEQFRLVYAQQMSKLTSEMSHLKKVQENLHEIDEQQSKNLKDQYEKLKSKMNTIEMKRNKQLDDKVKHYRQNDERWFHKLKEIQHKFKQQNRDAIQKAKKYREQSQNFWKDKEKKLQSQNSKATFENSNSRARRHQYTDAASLNRSYIKQQNPKYHHQFNGSNKRMTVNDQFNRDSSKKQIDKEIQAHKEKSQSLEKERELFIFKKAFEKMQRIEEKRSKTIKLKQSKPAEPTKPRHVDYTHASMNERSRKKVGKKDRHKDHSLYANNRHKESLDKMIQDHLVAKQQLEEKEFQERGEIMESNIQRNRKERIMKMIKNKVHSMKVEAIKKEGSKTSLGL